MVQHVDRPHDDQGQVVSTFEITVAGQQREINVSEVTRQVVRNEVHN